MAARISDEILTITISNPGKMNAISQTMWQELKGIMQDIPNSPSIRAVVIQGEGTDSFASGADISEFESSRDPKHFALFDQNTESALLSVLHTPVPTVAVIRGLCFGGGLSLAMACDYRIADITAQFAIPAARLGISYPGASLERLVKAVGPEYAKILLFTAERVDANRALQMNLVQEVLPSEKVANRVEQILKRLRENAPLSIRASKAIINSIVHEIATTDVTLDLALDMSDLCISSEDYKEGVRAFLEHRAPKFKGS